jgi:hypothetical protein
MQGAIVELVSDVNESAMLLPRETPGNETRLIGSDE